MRLPIGEAAAQQKSNRKRPPRPHAPGAYGPVSVGVAPARAEPARGRRQAYARGIPPSGPACRQPLPRGQSDERPLAGLLTSGHAPDGAPSRRAFSTAIAVNDVESGFRSRSQRRGRSGFSPDSLFFRAPQALEHQGRGGSYHRAAGCQPDSRRGPLPGLRNPRASADRHWGWGGRGMRVPAGPMGRLSSPLCAGPK